ncbi:MAG: hypothetical protein FGM24_02850 [Candidatus Kapabacteria bacterium]|nr:hypothetical protein [Candidatus Kapabacteria bacterium]
MLCIVEARAQHDQPRIKVGDTVLIKSRHRTHGVVIAFPGTSTCDAYLNAIASIERTIANLPIDMVVYATLNFDHVHTGLVNDYHFKSPVYDDGFSISSSVYHVEAYPTVLVVAPSGVVRYVSSLVGGSGYDSRDLLKAVNLSIAEGSHEVFRGEERQRGRMIAALGLHAEVSSPSFTNATVLYDAAAKAVFIWNVPVSSTSFMIDSAGNVTGRYDMEPLVQIASAQSIQLIHWDRDQERILVSIPDAVDKSRHLRWFNMRSGQVTREEALDAIPPRRKAQHIVYHAPSATFIQMLRPNAATIHDDNPLAAAYCTNGTTASYLSDTLQEQFTSLDISALRNVSFASCRQGWISYGMHDSLFLLHDLHSAGTSQHPVALPMAYSNGNSASSIATDERGGACEGIMKVLPDSEDDRVFIQYRIPTAALDNTANTGCSSIMIHYDTKSRRVHSAFEIPREAEPFAAANGAVLCKRFDLVPARVVWYTAPETELYRN